jgi:hypothetical protein
MPVIMAGDVIVGESDALLAACCPLPADSASFASRSRAPSPCRRAQLDVGGLQVAMDDALLVRRLERLRDLPRNRQRFVHWNRALSDSIGERRTVDELQDERVHVAESSNP